MYATGSPASDVPFVKSKKQPSNRTTESDPSNIIEVVSGKLSLSTVKFVLRIRTEVTDSTVRAPDPSSTAKLSRACVSLIFKNPVFVTKIPPAFFPELPTKTLP
jgi:hypothetical protein